MAVKRRRSSRRRSTKRKTRRSSGARRQRGGNRDILENADGIPIVNPKAITFTVKWQPTIKAANFGPVFTVDQTRPEPQVVWTAPVSPAMHTLIVWDPDAPAKSWLHWLVVNCTGPDPSTGNQMAKWYSPNPPPSSGEHRYVFGLFKQSSMINLPKIENRGGFNVAKFGAQVGLVPLAYSGIRINT